MTCDYDGDRITRIELSKVMPPLDHALSDTKVLPAGNGRASKSPCRLPKSMAVKGIMV